MVVSRTRCGILHAAPQSRDRTKHRRLVRPRISSAPRREERRAALRPGNENPARNVGNGITHLLRLDAIRATLGSPRGFERTQL